MTSLYLDDIITMAIFIIIAVIIPLWLTFCNVYNLFAKTPNKPKFHAGVTMVVGGILYLFLYSLQFETAGDWNESVSTKHFAISSKYSFAFGLVITLGLVGLCILINFKSEKLPPLVSAFSIAGVVLLNILQILFAIQISKNTDGIIDLLFYVYHANIFILSVSAVKKQILEQIKIFEDIYKNSENSKKTNWLYQKINSISKYAVLVFACLFFMIAILEIIFILTGQGADATIKAFTDTADWTFSKQTPPPPEEYKGHYLCTVASGGHKKVVKPLRYGKRQGQIIIVNRQLCIANAFEDFIQEKFPKFHKFIRGVYDKYGYPISKHITTPCRADIVYFFMKPLEWLFLVFLYAFDTKPEQRIGRQYI